FGLDVDPGAVPAQERMDGVGMAQIMDAGDTPLRGADIGAAEEAVQIVTEARTRIGPQSSTAVYEKRKRGGVRQAPTGSQEQIHLARGVVGERDEARFVELRRAYEERALGRIIVAEDEANELAAAQPRRVEQHDGEAKYLGAQGCVGPGPQRRGDAQ